MAFTQHTISGNIVNALGLPFGTGIVQVTATPLTSTTALVDGNTARLGAVVADVPLSGALSLTLVDGPWRIRVATTGQAYGQPAFQPIIIETNISADTSWGALIATATDIEAVNDVVTELRDKDADLQQQIDNLPVGGGGGDGGPITAANITDASTSGKSVLTGTPAAARTALGLGTAAQQPASAFVSPAALDQRVRGLADLLEPSGYKYVVKVNGTSGTSIADAMNAARSKVVNGAEDPHPRDRALVILPAGTYNQRIDRATIPGFIDVISESLDPADVLIDSPDGNGPAWEVAGHGGILAGVRLRNTHPLTGNVAGAVHSGATQAEPREHVFYRVVMESTNDTDTFSWGLAGGHHLHVLQCTITGSKSPLYLHNFPVASQTRLAPVRANFIDTTLAGTTAAGILDEGSTQNDELYWRGGSLGPGLNITFLNGVSTPSWIGAIDPAAGNPSLDPGIAIVKARPAVTRSPLVGRQVQAYYGVDGRGTARNLNTAPGSLAYTTVTPNRVYYTPFTVPMTMTVGGYLTSVGGTGGGQFAGAIHQAAADGTPGFLIAQNFSDGLTAGQKVTNIMGGRYLYPGQVYYTATRVTSGTATVLASNTQWSTARCYYQDAAGTYSLPNPASATEVTTAQTIPWAQFVSA